jgi:hypothetical protein
MTQSETDREPGRQAVLSTAGLHLAQSALIPAISRPP